MSEKIRGSGQMTVGGKTRPFQVNGIRQTQKFCEELGIGLAEYGDYLDKIHNGKTGAEFQLSNHVIVATYIYSALYAGAKRERLPEDFDCENVVEWYENAEASEAIEFLKPLHMLYEMLGDIAKAKIAAEEEKKA